MKQKGFFIIFQGLSVSKNCLRSAAAHLIVLAIKIGLLCGFAKTLMAHLFMGDSDTGFNLSITIDL